MSMRDIGFLSVLPGLRKKSYIGAGITVVTVVVSGEVTVLYCTTLVKGLYLFFFHFQLNRKWKEGHMVWGKESQCGKVRTL